MDIDSDSDLEIVSETDGNQNIEKIKRQKTTMEYKTTPSKVDTVQCPSEPKNLKCKVFLLRYHLIFQFMNFAHSFR